MRLPWVSALLLLILFIVFYAHAQTAADPPPTTPDVHVKLVLADNKTTFRIGEPIRLVMEFAADAPGYIIDILSDREQPTSDSISISPDSGVTHWLDEMTRGFRYARDVFSSQKLSSTPTRVGLTLNDTLRFDRPGHYTVRVTTRRVSSGPAREPKSLALTTNDVSFDLRPMSEQEEQTEVKRISTLLDTKRDWQSEENVATEFSYLTGDSSTREKVRRFLNPDNRSGNYSSHIWYGLYIAKNRDLVLQLLENALRDTNQPVSSSLLRAVSSIRFLKENNALPIQPKGVNDNLNPDGDPRSIQIQNSYLSELALGLSKRSGKSLTTTAMTILTSSNKSDANRATTTGEARRVLVQQFAGLHPYDQEYLLRMFWDDLRDTALVGPLKQMLSYNATASKNIHDPALQRLLELSPDDARPYVIIEICEPRSLVNAEILGSLSNKALPEVDACLLEQLRRLASSGQVVASLYLEHKAALAARYASESIYQDVMQIYRDTNSRLRLEARAALLAYLAKYNETEVLPLIEQTLAGVQPDENMNFLPAFTKLYYSDAVAEVLKKRLEAEEPRAASNAAYLLGLHGAGGDQQFLQSRLERWQKEWGERSAEAEANMQGMVEREVIWALLHGKSWKLSAERVKELQQSCVTKMCKQSIQVP